MKGILQMIYTVTFNPAVDYVVHTDEMKTGLTNRSTKEEVYFGGKGINVSVILNELGVKSRALGFVAGFTGDAVEKGISDQGIETDFIHLKRGLTRINVKIKADDETELNCSGPDIDEESVNILFEKLDKLEKGDILILAGSIPKSLPADIYARILEKMSAKGVSAAVDATGKLLLNVLEYKPFVVKPNNFELGDMFGVELHGTDEVIEYAKKLRSMGAVNVLVSMAGDGAVLVDENDQVHVCGVCSGTVKNSVGAGDSMLAGFIAGYSEKHDYGYALKLGTASGGATAFSDGLASGSYIRELFETL